MTLLLHVVLLSGQTASVLLESEATVNDLKVRAQQKLQVLIAGLFSRDGTVLKRGSKLKDVTLCSGDTVSATVRHAGLASSRISKAFALLRDGHVVTWGDADFGGDSSQVQDELRDVEWIEAGSGAFAAIRDNGTVVTWGHPVCGGSSRSVQQDLRGVIQICSSSGAFAAVRSDGSVVAWGIGAHGADTSRVAHRLRSVKVVRAAGLAFAAVLHDGTVVAWGDLRNGGDCSDVQDQ